MPRRPTTSVLVGVLRGPDHHLSNSRRRASPGWLSCEWWNTKRPAWRSAQAGRGASRFRNGRSTLRDTSSNDGFCCTGYRVQLRVPRVMASVERTTRHRIAHRRDESCRPLACASDSVVRELSGEGSGHADFVLRDAEERGAETTNRAADDHAKAVPSGLSSAVAHTGADRNSS